jgi:hypothetical protein
MEVFVVMYVDNPVEAFGSELVALDIVKQNNVDAVKEYAFYHCEVMDGVVDESKETVYIDGFGKLPYEIV